MIFNSFTEPAIDNLVGIETTPTTKLNDTTFSNNDFYGEVQQNWNVSMSTITLPENIPTDQFLTLAVDDRVKIIEENDNNKEWYFGEITDKSDIVKKGWFPACCLKPFTKSNTSNIKNGSVIVDI